MREFTPPYPKKTFTKIQDICLSDKRSRASMVNVVKNPAGSPGRVSQLTTPAFDAVLRDIFVPLIAGGTICIPPGRDTILDIKKLIDWIDIEGINVIHCVPSLFRAIVNEDVNSDYFAELTHILMAGEPLPTLRELGGGDPLVFAVRTFSKIVAPGPCI